MATIWDKLGWTKGPAGWESAQHRVKFGLLHVGVADGTIWELNILEKPVRVLGPVEGARADITDPQTTRSKSNTALVAASILTNTGPGFLAKTKVTKWQTAVLINGRVVAANTIDSLSFAKRALKEVTAFNKLAGDDKLA